MLDRELVEALGVDEVGNKFHFWFWSFYLLNVALVFALHDQVAFESSRWAFESQKSFERAEIREQLEY